MAGGDFGVLNGTYQQNELDLGIPGLSTPTYRFQPEAFSSYFVSSTAASG